MARSSLGLLHVIFRKFVPKLWSMIYAEISFWLNILRTGFFSPNFIYAFILTRSSLGFLHVIFRTFVPESWHLIYAKNLFPFNILRRNGHNFTKFYTCIHIDTIYLWIVAHHFRTFVPELWPLIYSKISFPLSILRTNGQILTKLYVTI